MPNLVDIKNSCESSRERVNDFLRGKDTVFWWGAGSASVILLNEIERDVLDNTKIVVIDGDRNKSNLTIPGVNLKVNHYSTIGNLHINNLVIASSFYKEIFDSIRLSGGVVAQISQQIMISPAPSDRYTRGFLTGRPRVFSLFIALTYAITSPT
ncbi:hypothetical protein [Aeromonas salmonicida]|nr:hypothetical protein [Aeromonas salmonicida]